MTDLTKLSAAKLHAVIAKREAVHSALLDETIAAGYGETRHNDLVRMAREDGVPLLVEYVAASDSLSEARWELDARQRYHGGDKPIRRAA
jgi:hypothetical protein